MPKNFLEATETRQPAPIAIALSETHFHLENQPEGQLFLPWKIPAARQQQSGPLWSDCNPVIFHLFAIHFGGHHARKTLALCLLSRFNGGHSQDEMEEKISRSRRSSVCLDCWLWRRCWRWKRAKNTVVVRESLGVCWTNTANDDGDGAFVCESRLVRKYCTHTSAARDCMNGRSLKNQRQERGYYFVVYVSHSLQFWDGCVLFSR